MRLALTAVVTLAAAGPASARVCSKSSCRGGPGLRSPSGARMSWRIDESFCDGACYSADMVDE